MDKKNAIEKTWGENIWLILKDQNLSKCSIDRQSSNISDSTVLQNVIGLNLARQRQAIVNYGFDTCNWLKNMSEADLRGLLVQLNATTGVYRQHSTYPWIWQLRLICLLSAKSSLRDRSVPQRWDYICSFSWIRWLQISSLQNTENGKLQRKQHKGHLSPQSKYQSLHRKIGRTYRALVETLGRSKGVSLVPLLYIVQEDTNGDYEL